MFSWRCSRAVLAGSCLAAVCACNPPPHGTVDVAASSLVTEEHAIIDSCQWKWGGAALYSHGQRALLVAQDFSLVLTDRNGGDVTLGRADCPSYDVSFQYEGGCDPASNSNCHGTYSPPTSIGGHAHAVCDIPGGGSLEADVDFPDCE